MVKMQFVNLKKFSRIFLKVIILAFVLIWFGLSAMMTISVSWENFIINNVLLLICLSAFILTFFAKIRKKAYKTFCISVIIYIIFFCFFPSIPIRIAIDKCGDSEKGVWDYEQSICRQDCYKWDKEYGCYKNEGVTIE